MEDWEGESVMAIEYTEEDRVRGDGRVNTTWEGTFTLLTLVALQTQS